jgi:hypothetical protein
MSEERIDPSAEERIDPSAEKTIKFSELVDNFRGRPVFFFTKRNGII